MPKKSLAKQSTKSEKKVVMVSGGFDPIHIGHVRMFQEAKKLGNELVVVLNNDNWLKFKKGFVFMSQEDRKEIIEAIEGVDHVFITGHKKNTKDISICREIELIRPHIFANGGDRKPEGDPVPEVELCKKLGIEIIYNVGHGGKVRSSSELVRKARAIKIKKI
jgi:D-beta-D-heptose 7-phosphate kinase/D-beta-D-heptose 1-phosphate adenosyltransferase